jgi:hypothetical protein
MAVFADIKRNIKVLVRRLSGHPAISHDENDVIVEAINRASYEIATEYGVPRLRTMTVHTSVTTAASTEYADLSGNYSRILQDTVRIESEETQLQSATLEYIVQYNLNPDAATGTPLYYALDSDSTNEDVIRLRFAPIPDDAYTVDFVAVVMPTDESFSLYPDWVEPALSDKAHAFALRDLGFFAEADQFESSATRRFQRARNIENGDGALHINRATPRRSGSVQSRIV